MHDYLDRKFLNRLDEKSYRYSIFHCNEIQGLNYQESVNYFHCQKTFSPLRSHMEGRTAECAHFCREIVESAVQINPEFAVEG